MGRLQDKVAIITGAGQGIGLAYADRFLAEGAKVVVAEINEDRAAGAMKALEGKGESIFVKTDISDPESAQHCVDEAVKAFGTVDILVNNAALYYDIDNDRNDFEYLQRSRSVNQHGAWLMATGLRAGDGRSSATAAIINQSSGAAYVQHVRRVQRRVHRPRQLQLLDHEVGHRRAHEVHGRAARQLEHHRQLHRAGRHDDRSDEEGRARHVHPGHDGDDRDEEHARARRPRRCVPVLRE